MRRLCLLAFGLFLAACAPTPPARVLNPKPPDAADALARYYEQRIVPTEGGYRVLGQVYGKRALPSFYDSQGATLAAKWARDANFVDLSGWSLGGATLLAGLAVSVNASPDSPAKGAWWVAVVPAGLLTWTYTWIADGWWRKPSVALYNRDLAAKLGIQMVQD